MEEKRRLVGSCTIHCFGSSKKKKLRYEIVWKVWNTCMKLLFSILVREVWICWLGNPPNSLFAYVWV